MSGTDQMEGKRSSHSGSKRFHSAPLSTDSQTFLSQLEAQQEIRETGV